MDKLAAFVALIALGGVAWLAFGQEAQSEPTDVAEQMAQIRAEQASISDRLDQLLAARKTELVSGNATPASGSAGPALQPHSSVHGAEVEALPIDERVARLEERLRAQDETVAELKKKGPTSPMRISSFGGKRFFRSPDDAATALEMSDAQKSDMERVLENAKHELDRLYDTQDENGDTLSALQKKMSDAIKNRKGDEPYTNLLSHISSMAKFKQGKIPGSDETFAKAEQRIHKNAMDEIRRGLSPKQQKDWDNSHTAGLLPGAGGTTTVSTVMVGEPTGVFFGEEEEK